MTWRNNFERHLDGIKEWMGRKPQGRFSEDWIDSMLRTYVPEWFRFMEYVSFLGLLYYVWAKTGSFLIMLVFIISFLLLSFYTLAVASSTVPRSWRFILRVTLSLVLNTVVMVFVTRVVDLLAQGKV